jgi:acyl carrier protein
VALGYLGDPAATALRFRPDPHGPPGARAYWTGDLVRRRADGVLDFLGRRDDQVKLHGVRVELGEVDAALCRHPAVVDAASVLRIDGPAPRLAALVVAPGATEEQLRRHLLDELPVALLPATIDLVDALPLGPTGKLDRRAVLAALDRPARPRVHAPPETELERTLAGLWAEVLDEAAVGRHDSFFDLGGHSLLATRLTSLVRDALGVELPLRELFAQPTVAGTAAWLATRPADPRAAVDEPSGEE